MILLFLALGTLILALFFLLYDGSKTTQNNKKSPRKKWWQFLLIIPIGLGVLWLALSNKLIAAIGGGALPLIMTRFLNRIIPNIISQLFQAHPQNYNFMKYAAKNPHKKSSDIETDYLSMKINLEDGNICGRVKKGVFNGRNLSSLDFQEALQLRTECQQDQDSLTIIDAWIEHSFQRQWQEYKNSSNAAMPEKTMTKKEAYAILGVDEDADKKEIQAAYHKLMSKLHPDAGGSDWLAARINSARDTLIG